MRKSLICLFCFMFLTVGLSAYAFIVMCSRPGYLFWEDFDGSSACGDGSHTNCRNSYTVTPAVVDFNVSGWSGNALHLDDDHDGAPSAQITADNAWSAQATVYVKFGLKFENGFSSADEAAFFAFRTADPASAGNLRLVHDGTDHHLKIRHSTVSSGNGTTIINTGTTYYIWMKYVVGSGSDGVLDLWVSTTNAFPGVGNEELQIANGDGTLNIAGFLSYSPQAKTSVDFDLDDIVWQTAAF